MREIQEIIHYNRRNADKGEIKREWELWRDREGTTAGRMTSP